MLTYILFYDTSMVWVTGTVGASVGNGGVPEMRTSTFLSMLYFFVKEMLCKLIGPKEQKFQKFQT